MFSRLLIANRGEIACRIIHTAQKMGLHTIAVYTDAEPSARHVRLAQSRYHLGPAAAQESYLNIAALMRAATQMRADALHPGYGFLSENPALADACQQAGITFIGPHPDTLRAMGNKTAAKAQAQQAGIPVMPQVVVCASASAEDLIHAVETQLGWPVLIKAVSGGGGRGMRVARTATALKAHVQSAQQEAQVNFGQSTVFIEPYLEQARHIEVQIMGDRYGQVVHLFERDCTLQRRHQKIIEESPAPHLSTALRTALYRFACQLAQHVGYVGAGTVEFLVKGEQVYFMEMNARLQVEHTVTEMRIEEDLVAWQLQIAAGHPLPLTQAALCERLRTQQPVHVIEARLCAEDPQRNFAPAAGTITYLPIPQSVTTNLRVDTGFESGDHFPPHYAALIAKIIIKADTRDQAIAQLKHHVQHFAFIGPTTNQAFLSQLLSHPDVVSGHTHTQFIDQHLAAQLTLPTRPMAAADSRHTGSNNADFSLPPAPDCACLIATVFVHDSLLDRGGRKRVRGMDVVWQCQDAFRLYGEYRYLTQWVRHILPDSLDVPVSHVTHCMALTVHTPSTLTLEDGMHAYPCVLMERTLHRIRIRLHGIVIQACVHVNWHGHTAHCVQVQYAQHQYTFFSPAACTTGQMATPIALPDKQYVLSAPMTGVITDLPIDALTLPATVKKGDRLLQMEAMKLLHTLTAPCHSRLLRIAVSKGEAVQQGAPLIILEPDVGENHDDACA